MTLSFQIVVGLITAYFLVQLVLLIGKFALGIILFWLYERDSKRSEREHQSTLKRFRAQQDLHDDPRFQTSSNLKTAAVNRILG